ncbi:double-cubane-cluster-containing anaerobic reductase [Clostridium ihumii]|uniref:double-cubane-cluster-containing anaerobic reductase n=1 Tax=Clostridium ihumii TaxID=1470356 RepID=UPI00058B4F93|nr:double-cubane-cluster-containing anaerobic reductase [Clostridium ihumii]
MSDFPSIFNEFSEARKNGFIKVKDLKEQGKKVVGVFCTYTPCEIIYASGAVPVSLCGMSEEPIPDAERDLPKNLCPLIKSSYGFALTEKCPYTYFSDLLVGETTCDGKKKMYEYLGKIKPMHVMQLPQAQDREHGLKVWKNEMIFLKEKLEKEFDVTISDEDLRKAIKLKNEERLLLQEFYSLGKLVPPAISGYEMYKVLEGTGFSFDKKEQNNNIRRMIDDLKADYEKNGTKVDKNAKRILVTGCPMGGTVDKVVKTIEENGGVVVCYENCGGVKEKAMLVDESKDPMEALAEKYLSIPCSVMAPNDGRMELLNTLIDEYKIEGVVDLTLQACHTYNIETKRVRDFVINEKAIPYMSLETDYSKADIGQIKTRISAFIEML